MLNRFLANYVARHRNRWNQLLHLLGVPMTFVASVVLLIFGQWWWALGAFVGGYALQFLGHAVEGNDAGELVLLKRLLGRPYTEFAPRPAGAADAAGAAEVGMAAESGPGAKRSSCND